MKERKPVVYRTQQDSTNTVVTVYNKNQVHQLDAPISQIYFWNKTLHVLESSSVHHQEFFTVHTAMSCHTGLLTAYEQEQDGTPS